MKYLKVFESFLQDEENKLKKDYDSKVEELNKQFQLDSKEVASYLTDEYPVLEEDLRKKYLSIFKISFPRMDIDNVFKHLEYVIEVAKTKNFEVGYVISFISDEKGIKSSRRSDNKYYLFHHLDNDIKLTVKEFRHQYFQTLELFTNSEREVLNTEMIILING